MSESAAPYAPPVLRGGAYALAPQDYDDLEALARYFGMDTQTYVSQMLAQHVKAYACAMEKIRERAA